MRAFRPFSFLSGSTISLIVLAVFVGQSWASLGDRLPDFKECVKICEQENCQDGNSALPIYLRLMLWTCAAECDYTCQHVVTDSRVNREFPMLQPVVQFHGKWPFYRVLGMQEVFSVLFSLFNFLAHYYGLGWVKSSIPASYPLRKYYVGLAYCGFASWTFSMIFHCRDFPITEKLDYWAAGASVLYGMFLAVIRIFRLDNERPRFKPTLRRLWTYLCVGLYIAHVSYLTFWSWDYTYNMIANVVVGVLQNLLWTAFSIYRYRQDPRKSWTTWPSLIVVWVSLVMSLELFDFPPWWGLVDAHSLWHLGTVVPTIWWYLFLIEDARNDLASERLKA